MKYLGSKRRLSKYILPIILKDRKPNQCYVEPFVGGGNLIDKVDGYRIGSDAFKPVIDALTLIRDNPQSLPEYVSEEEYKRLKFSEDPSESGLKGFIGFTCSFGAKYFCSYARDKKNTNYAILAKRNALKQSPKLQGVELIHCSYDELDIPANSIIYCDPPYFGIPRYKVEFNHDKFWDWCRDIVTKGHKLFISEYNAPSDFVSIFEREQTTNVANNYKRVSKPTEKLFVHKSQLSGIC